MAIRIPFVPIFYRIEEKEERIATPACRLARNDSACFSLQCMRIGIAPALRFLRPSFLYFP